MKRSALVFAAYANQPRLDKLGASVERTGTKSNAPYCPNKPKLAAIASTASHEYTPLSASMSSLGQINRALAGWSSGGAGSRGVALTSAVHAITDTRFDHVGEICKYSTRTTELGHAWWPNRRVLIQACQHSTPVTLLETFWPHL